MRAAASASLATAGEKGQPFVSLVTPAVAADGAVLLWISTLSEHTRQLSRNPRCGLLFQGVADGPNPQTAPRVSMTGMAERIEDGRLKARWLARHPYAAMYAGFADFSLWRIVPEGGLMVLGFGRASRLRAEDLSPEPAMVTALEEVEAEALAMLNGMPERLAAAARSLGGGEGTWRAASLSPDGFDLVDEEAERVLFLDLPGLVPDRNELLSALQHALPRDDLSNGPVTSSNIEV